MPWIKSIYIVNKCKKLYGPNKADMVTPQRKYPKYELLQFTMTFGCIQDSTSIRNEVESAIEFIINVLHSDFAVPFYQDYLKDKHSRLLEKFSNSAGYLWRIT